MSLRKQSDGFLPLIKVAENEEEIESRVGDAMHASGRKAREAHGVGFERKADHICLLAQTGLLDGVAAFRCRLFSVLNSEFS